MMIRVDASNTYFGGGFVLLREFIRNVELQGIETTVYVGYPAVYKELNGGSYKHVTLVKTNAIQTFFRYFHKTSRCLFFCSLPPFVKCENSVVYFHNPHFLSCPKLSIRNFKYILYHYWVKFFRGNVDFFACQTDRIAEQLIQMGCQVERLPFYLKVPHQPLSKEYDFCYVSTSAPHKNHLRLFEAIEQLSDKGRGFKCVVTIRNTPKNASLTEKIAAINAKTGREVIVNLGFVNRSEIERVLNSSKCVVFPSLRETFGLPIAEALSCGVRILSSDLPFTHDLLDTPIVFDPEDVDSIAQAMEADLCGKNDKIIQNLKISDKLNELIEYLNK